MDFTKIINSLKATYDDLKKNQEIMTLIEAFGLDFDTKTLKMVYDKKKLRYDKIIIMSDADVNYWRMKDFSLSSRGSI